MTVVEASKILHDQIDRRHVDYSLDELRALCIATSVLDSLPESTKEMVNCIWDGKPNNLSMLVGNS